MCTVTQVLKNYSSAYLLTADCEMADRVNSLKHSIPEALFDQNYSGVDLLLVNSAITIITMK